MKYLATSNNEAIASEKTNLVYDIGLKKSDVIKELITARNRNASNLFNSGSTNPMFTTEIAFEMLSGDALENAITLQSAFRYANKVESYPKMNTKNVINFGATFNLNTSLATPPDIDTSNATDISNIFTGCSSLLYIPLYDTKKVTTANAAFQTCRALKIIGELDFRSCTNFNGMLWDDTGLEEIWIKNIKANLQVGSPGWMGDKIKPECLIHLIKELRYTDSAKTLSIGATNLAKITGDNAVYVRTIPITDEMRAEDDLIDEKLPFEVCESTDEGAMLITEYVLEKNWQIAG